MSRSFNGSSDKIQTSYGPGTYSTGLSVAFWFKVTTAGSNNRIAATGHTDANGHGFQIFVVNATTPWDIEVDIGDGASVLCNQQTTGSPFSTGVWAHFLVTFQCSNGRAIYYVNGLSNKNTLTNSGTVSGGVTLAVGYGSTELPSGFFNGQIADCAVWDTFLSDTEAFALGKGVRPNRIRPANLKGWWPLSGLQSPEPDLSGFVNNGTLTGTSLAFGPQIMPITPRWQQSLDIAVTPPAGPPPIGAASM